MHIKRIGAGKPMAFRGGKKGKKVTGNAVQAGSSEPERITNKLDKVIVAESKLPSAGQRAKTLIGRARKHRYFKPVAYVFAGIVLVTGLIVIFGRDKDQPMVGDDGPKCTYQMLENAKANFKPQLYEKLEPQAKAIEQIDGYDTDANCLYVVLTHYINMSESQKAREVYDKLNAVYDPETGYATVLAGAARPPEQLKQTIEYMESQAGKDQGGLNKAMGGEL